MKNEIVFVGGIGNRKWIKDGKNLSRNYPQGNRVFHSCGIATCLTSQPMGGAGGYTGLYLVIKNT